jgi:DNA-binding transcriptional LysR family regulator
MELRDLRYFVALVAEGSLLAAAKRLRIAPSTLGQQSYRMERELKTKLFVRRRGSIRLTVAGKIMRAHTRAPHPQVHLCGNRRSASGGQDQLVLLTLILFLLLPVARFLPVEDELGQDDRH